ncbi:J domain-containing protein [Pontibacter akesuensis]|uniref:DnaJ domain-containing protein n=1 Tax=Pontibacter akesuensis TaxID=388950 RepID=A0A1I7KTU6_9BACT|nr:J domain-containing protein [Pontibacter akesuensis]GHA80619.1 hypothetical protein GCM10007389_38700 [Pontibacter akesuensis]SFV00883.1 hypothetical protein SAMN04487941_4110 [Pontibacter akesuensis]
MSLQKYEPQPDKRLNLLEKEIAALEAELSQAEREVNTFVVQIRSRLHVQLNRLHELADLYRQQKKAKMAKRLAQKKKGKNYREPQGIQKTETGLQEKSTPATASQQELKRLYKDAIRLVHPDKFVNEEADKSERATALTVQLNDLYESGDLDELKGFYEHIISGNAMSHVAYKPGTAANPAAMLAFLQKKKQELEQALQEAKSSQLYTVLTTYPQPETFIAEVAQQFEERIKLLEKRTRKARK